MKSTPAKLISIVVLLLLLFTITGGLALAGPKDRVLKIGAPMQTTVENPWNRAFFLACDKAKANGYKFKLHYTERVTRDNITRVLRSYCEQGYDVIFDHSNLGYDDLKAGLRLEYPKMVFMGGGIAYKPIEPNVGHYTIDINEAVYLCGVIAGMMTKTNVIGAVAAFPTPQQRELVNAFKRGALSVNPKIKLKLTYLQSWFDPAKGKEAALAQNAAGADFIFQERPGVAQACQEKGCYVFGNFLDHHETAPDHIITSAMVDWSVTVMKVLDRVLAGNFVAGEYTYSMREGGASLAPYYGFEDKLPKEVKDKVAELKAKIMDGTLIVPAERGKVKAD
jgi:basic membrane lipoprotein Med (substrate-binding protein (PBP1-ABC) superfamily)